MHPLDWGYRRFTQTGGGVAVSGRQRQRDDEDEGDQQHEGRQHPRQAQADAGADVAVGPWHRLGGGRGGRRAAECGPGPFRHPPG